MGMKMAAFIKLAESLPEAQLRIGDYGRSLRVRGKPFGYLSDDDSSAVLKTSLEEQSALVAGDPETFSLEWASAQHSWIRVQLARADRAELKELLDAAWRLTAPKRLAAAHL